MRDESKDPVGDDCDSLWGLLVICLVLIVLLVPVTVEIAYRYDNLGANKG
jgi:hypothetical protein